MSEAEHPVTSPNQPAATPAARPADHVPDEALLDTGVALVGLASRVPGARDPETFWQNLLNGVESIRDLTREELEARGVDAKLLDDPAYVRRGAALDGAGEWDAAFWGFSPKEAAVMDPQLRHFVELAWEAMESAGYAPGTLERPVGVFGGCGPNTYMMFQILGDPSILRDMGFFLVRHIGNDKDFLATRASYHLNLTGPGVGVQTACSTSLTATHLAVQSLLSFECDMALAGGITITFPHLLGYRFEEGEILAPDGHCRAFDAESAGTVLGDGGAIVALKRLRDAVEDGDTIHAVIRGSAMNNDGSSKVGYLAPSVEGQARVVAEALAVADVHPDTVGYVEAHGTGTRVGDPIEVTALTEAYRGQTARTGYCLLGSVKSNIGHLDTAAGVAALIKGALAVRDGEVPPSLHFSTPNPGLALDASPFRIARERSPWPAPAAGSTHPRRAGVSSLGVGGTNVHVVLEEPPTAHAPGAPPADDPRAAHLLVLSARNRGALERTSARLVDHLEAHPEQGLADVAFTLQAGRARFRESRILVGRTREELLDALLTGDPARVEDHSGDDRARSAAFLFAGGGAQYAGMARGLYENEPVYRDEVDRALRHLGGLGEAGLLTQVQGLLGIGSAPPLPPEMRERPSVALPALFVVQMAQARLWMSWGVQPSAMIGHSMGEYSAAVLAGVLSMEEGLALVVLRGQLFEEVSGGGMLGVPLPEEALRRRFPEVEARVPGTTLSVAAVNGPELTVASGPREAIDALESVLADSQVEARRIHIDVAAHSAMLEPILGRFRARLQKATLRAPSLPFASNLTGTWITAAEATDPEYWVRQLRETVQFSKGLERLLEDPSQVLLEVGPGRTLATLARLHPSRDAEQEIFTSIRHPDEEVEDDRFMLQVLGRLWQRGVTVDWPGVHVGARRRRVPLPTYPFERDIHMVEPVFRLDPQADPRLLPGAVQGGVGNANDASPGQEAGTAGLTAGAGLPLEDWLHVERWGEWSPDPETDAVDQGRSLVLAPGNSMPEWLAHALEAGGVAWESSDAEGELSAMLAGSRRILYTGALDGGGAEGAFFGLLELGKALAEAMDEENRETGETPVELVVLTRGVTDGTGDPIGALVAGPVRVLPAETTGLRSRWVDLPMAEGGEALASALAASVPAGPADDPVTLLAIRDGRVLAPGFETASHSASQASEASAATESSPEPGARSVITGGFGGVGLEVARHLAQAPGARLALLGRTPLPPRDMWPELEADAAARGSDPRVLRAIGVIRELEEAGATVLPLTADVTDRGSLERARDRIVEAFGGVDAILHAAGVLDDGLALFKERAGAERVLAPKVEGTLLLDEVFRGSAAPDRVILFSSVSAQAGLPGQVDYTAANAFLDAMARGRPGWVSVGWSAWAETGMAVDAARGLVAWPPLAGPGTPWRPARGAAFDAVDPGTQADSGSVARVRTRLRKGRLWMLDEHQTGEGLPLIPGAGYLELLRGALAEVLERDDPGPFALEEVFFLAPFFVPEGDTRELEIRLPAPSRTDSDSHSGTDSDTGPAVGTLSGSFEIVGRNAPDEPWVEHVRGEVTVGEGAARDGRSGSTPAAAPPPATLSFEASDAGRKLRQDLKLGPRWANVRGVAELAEGGVELALELDPALVSDLEDHPLHPALLDNATALAGPLLPGFGEEGGVYVPASYGTFRSVRPFSGPRIRSWIRRGDGEEGNDARGGSGVPGDSGTMVTLDVVMTDESGELLAEARGFVMVRVSTEELARATSEAAARRTRTQAVDAAALEGIPTSMGLRVLDQALAMPAVEASGSYLLVTPGEPAARIARLRESAATSGSRGDGAGSDGPRKRREPPKVDVSPVESALEAMESVLEAAVTAHEDRPGEIRLVAHVVLDPGHFATVSELRRHLRAELPRDQVPQNFVQLDALPRFTSGARDGEVDRNALHDPFAPVDSYVAPTTPAQTTIAGIWEDLLGADRIGIHDNFLDVGGHSLLAMRAILRIEKATGVRVGPIEINMFTLEQIAALVDKGQAPNGQTPDDPSSSGHDRNGRNAPDAEAPDPETAEESKASTSGTTGAAAVDVTPEPDPVEPESERGGLLSAMRRFIPGS